MKKIKMFLRFLKDFFFKKREFAICFENDVEKFNLYFIGNWFELNKKMIELAKDDYMNIEFYIY